MTLQLVITRGLPASGKTTWARAWVANDPVRYARVSRDDFRQMLYGAGPDVTSYQAYFAAENLHVREAAVTAAEREAVRGLLENGRNVVVDDTNLRVRYVRQWAELARDHGAEFRIEDFTHVPAEECVRRDEMRGLKVGYRVIMDMAAKLASMGDALDAADEATYGGYRYEPDVTLRPAWIVDIDGTLAKMNGRSPYDLTRVSEDEPNHPVIATAHALAYGPGAPSILAVSGREGTEQCRVDTEDWLDLHVPFVDEILMRAEGDHRDDAQVKLEILRDQIAPRYHVLGVLDDRNRVVRMWRRVGLPCFQVADGAF